MAVEEAKDRRGRRVRGRSGLLERETALEAIDAVLDASAAGAGLALLVLGHPGMGKTRLYESSLDGARTRGLRVLRAAGAELEQNVAFGVAGQIARAVLAGLPEDQREAILHEAPAVLRGLAAPGFLDPGREATNDLAISHALFALLAAALETEAGLLAIDDLHWCDAASLEFILYLLQRLDELPLSIVMTRRPSVGEEVLDLLDRIAAHRLVRIETLTPLGEEAVAGLVRKALGDRSHPDLVQVCLEATGGNPFYLHELLLALRDESHLNAEELVERTRSLAPDAVARSVRVRVGRLGTDAAALARAVAVLGEDVPLRQAAALSGLEINRASAAADKLASVEVFLAREPLRFVHPLVRYSIERDIPASELSSRHLDAAHLLDREQASPELVAAHLLLGRAQGDPWAVEQLRAAAREASAQAAPRSVVRYLERALAEPPSAEARGEVLAELGIAEAALGLPSAADHLAAAAEAADDPRNWAELALRRGHVLYAQGCHEKAAAAYEQGLAKLSGEAQEPEQLELHDALQTGFVATASLVPSLQPEAVRRSSQLVQRAVHGPQTQGQRQLLAQAALHASLAGKPAPEVTALAEQAWSGGELLAQEGASGVAWSLLTSALCLAGDLERAIHVADAALEEARRTSSPNAFATASYARGLPELWRGEVTLALADLESALDSRRFGWRQFARAAAAHYALCLIEVGDLKRAEAVLAEEAPAEPTGDVGNAARLYALAELRRSQGRAAEALEVALEAGQLSERHFPFLGYCPWRGSAALAALAMGDNAQALERAQDTFVRSEQTQVLHQLIRSRRILGMCQPEEQGLETLRAAVELGTSSPPRLETIRSLVELGSALRRANERAAAREPLQRAVDLARDCGALALYERARVELSASGGRPRREALLSGPASLTPSERRIAELACNGASNRQIAQTLFVTPKTVEYHLRNAYRKLNIQSRRELAGVLAV
jgi:DNA-binding CsgD family transcriptional regulator